MANELTTVFLPIIAEDRMAEYGAADFQLNPRQNDPGIDIQLTPQDARDQAIWMIASGEVFFVSAGTTVPFENGPEINAPADRNVVVVHIISTYKWAPILNTSGQPVAEWWALEGVGEASFELLFALYDLEYEASLHGYDSGVELRDAVLSGDASLNVLLSDEQPVSLGSLETARDGSATLGVRAWANYDAGVSELDGASALAGIRQLAPNLAHPLLNSILADVSTRDVTVHVRFVYWDTKRDRAGMELNATSETDKGEFVPVPDGSRISLQKRSAGPLFTTLVEEEVTGNGQVALTAARADLNAVDLAAGESLEFRLNVPPDTYFLPQYQHAHHVRKADPFDADPQLPRDDKKRMIWGTNVNAWVTHGCSSSDEAIENLDFLVNYENSIVGGAGQPVEYYAGIPLFLQIQYPVVYLSGSGGSAKFKQEIRKAPKGVLVEIYDAAPQPLSKFRTDEHGQIWGMLVQRYDTLNLPLELKVKYEMEDLGIELLPMAGEVVEGGNPPVREYSSNADPTNSAPFSGPLLSSIGKPLGTEEATDLAAVQVGFVTIPQTAVSEFKSVDGRHAGVIHAFQQLRFVHQWFHFLTVGFELGGVDESWAAALSRHDGAAGVWPSSPTAADRNYDIALPFVRVTQPLPGVGEAFSGAADQFDSLPPAGGRKTRSWLLTLHGHDHFTVNQPMAGQPVPDDNKAQFWRVHTIWHEFTHAVINMALDRLFNLDLHNMMVLSKDGSTSGRVHGVILDRDDRGGIEVSGGWSTLEEALAAVPEIALMERASGQVRGLSQGRNRSKLFLVVDVDAAGNEDGVLSDTDLKLNEGWQVDLRKTLGPPTFNDQRLGLRVPIAFAWALWDALSTVGGFDTSLESFVTGNQALNDLRDAVPYLSSARAKELFQALFWGPLVASRTPDIPGVDPQWNGLVRSAYAPTTFSFMQRIETDFWGGLDKNDQKSLEKLFGDGDDPLSYYLWFSFP